MSEQSEHNVEPLSQDGRECLELMQRYIAMIRQYGGAPNIPEFRTLVEELYERLGSGLPHDIVEYPLYPRAEETRLELASQDQLEETWGRILGLAESAKPKGRVRLRRKKDVVERRVNLVDLPNWERWTSLLTTETTVIITPSLEEPDTVLLDLINFSAFVQTGSVFGKSNPLSLVAYVSIRFCEGEFKGLVGYLYDVRGQMKIYPDRGIIDRIDVETHSIVYEDMTADQVTTLLSYIPEVEKKV